MKKSLESILADIYNSDLLFETLQALIILTENRFQEQRQIAAHYTAVAKAVRKLNGGKNEAIDALCDPDNI